MIINDLQVKVNAAEEKVHKCENTIERHKKSKEKLINNFNELSLKLFDKTYEDWTIDDIRDVSVREIYWYWTDIQHKDDDIKGATNKLEDAKRVYNNWVEKLHTEEARQAYIEGSIPDIIKDFLNDWKTKTIEYMQNRKEMYFKDLEQYLIDKNYRFYNYIVDHRDDFNYIDDKYIDNFIPSYKYINHCTSGPTYSAVKRNYELNNIESAFKMKYSDPLFIHYKSSNFDNEWLDKNVEQEKNDKLIDLMTRVTKITGVITDASNLRVKNGELNGTIIGENGSVTVNTIGAGGYNVQRFHFRTLVHKLMSL
jgi:hypothetical protein